MRIVVVEDERPIREGLSKMIPKLGDFYEVTGTASSGSRGIKVIEETKPEVILMDIQMPDMDGLTMLKKLREKKIWAKVIVLTAYSEFDYAQQSIELGVSKYLLKPMKIKQLKQSLDEIREELIKENRGEKLLSLDHIFQSCFNGHTEVEMENVLKEKYRMHPKKEIYICSIYLPENRNIDKMKISELTARMRKNSGFQFVTVQEGQSSFFILYQWEFPDLESYIQNHVIPMFCENIKSSIIFAWEKADGIRDLEAAGQKIKKLLEWNLVFGRGILLTEEKIQRLTINTLNIPVNLEHDIRKAVIKAGQKEFRGCLDQFLNQCRKDKYEPSSIKEACIRCFWMIIHTMKEYGIKAGNEVFLQKTLNRLIHAVTWEQIDCVLKEGMGQLAVDKIPEHGRIKESNAAKAVRMIDDYYSQGITLGEIADKLCISEEYLSSQIKKETGSSFSALIKEKRIRKIKKLLVTTKLKLSQIAALTGYTDPKYMSKVFREETGILPSEYRKTH